MDEKVIGYLVIALLVVMAMASMKQRSLPLFGLVLLNRWMRWMLFGFGIAFLARDWGLTERPFWALAPAFLLFWVLVETVYTWLAVKALSVSEIPVFPRYRETTEKISWPVLPYFLKIKEQIREMGFSVESSLSADLGMGLKMQSLLYFSEDRRTRLQVLFVPRAKGCPATFLILSSFRDDVRWMTDNVWLPAGGIFPAQWRMSRKPFVSSLRRLFRKHRNNLKRWKADPEEFPGEAVDFLNAEQDVLDRANIDRGILFPRGQRPEFGKLTGDGKYRVWKQILLLNYFGWAGDRTSG